DDWAVRQGRELLDSSERLAALGVGEDAVADCYGAAFLPDPILVPACEDVARHQFFAQLFDTPEYRSLHEGTALNALAAATAATAFAEQIAALKKEDQARESGGGGKDGAKQEIATLRAVGRALAEAREGVEECQEAAAAFGLGPGSPGSNDAGAIAALFKRV